MVDVDIIDFDVDVEVLGGGVWEDMVMDVDEVDD